MRAACASNTNKRVNKLFFYIVISQSFVGIHDPFRSHPLLSGNFEIDIHEILKTRLNFNFVIPQFSDKIENSASIVSTRAEKTWFMNIHRHIFWHIFWNTSNGSPCPDMLTCSFSSFWLKPRVFWKNGFDCASGGPNVSFIFVRVNNSDISVQHSNVGVEVASRSGARGHQA